MSKKVYCILKLVDKQEFFLRTLDDLRAKRDSQDTYNLLRGSGLVRQLLWDTGEPMVVAINRECKLKINFTTLNVEIGRLQPLKLGWRWLDPARFPIASTRTVNRDQFLATPMLDFEFKTYTVLQILHYCAHYRGGIHSGKSDGIFDALEKADQKLMFSGLDASGAALIDIIQVVLNGLKPLEDLIRRRLSGKSEQF